jgi:hypothetical protein
MGQQMFTHNTNCTSLVIVRSSSIILSSQCPLHLSDFFMVDSLKNSTINKKAINRQLRYIIQTMYNQDDILLSVHRNFLVECFNLTDHGKRLLINMKHIKLVSKRANLFGIVYNDNSLHPFRLEGLFKDKKHVYMRDVRIAMGLDATFNKRTPEVMDLSCHHAGIPMREILHGFLKLKNLTLEDIDIAFNEKEKRNTIKDESLRCEWITYHDERATLVWLTSEEHRIVHLNTEKVKKKYKILPPTPKNLNGNLTLSDNVTYIIAPDSLMIKMRHTKPMPQQHEKLTPQQKIRLNYVKKRPEVLKQECTESLDECIKPENRGKAALANKAFIYKNVRSLIRQKN